MVPDFLVAVPRFISLVASPYPSPKERGLSGIAAFLIIFLSFFNLSYDGQHTADLWPSVSWLMVSSQANDVHRTIIFLCAKLWKSTHSCKLLHSEIILLTSLFWRITFVAWIGNKLALASTLRLENIVCYFSSRSVSNAEQTLLAVS